MYDNLTRLISDMNLAPEGTEDSTSIHFLNGDSNLNETGTILYLLLNYVNNVDDIESLNIDQRIFANSTIKDFYIDEQSLKDAWPNLDRKASPSRLIGNLFWSQLPWSSYGDLRVLDIGCGSGHYAQKLSAWTSGKIKSYTGFDVSASRNWNEMVQWGEHHDVSTSFKTVNLDSEDLSRLIPRGTNFFMSQSALEHLRCDLKYFKSVKNYIDSVDFPVTQVHLFPGTAALKLFLLHGYRQYGLNSIAKIAKIFNKDKITLTRIGGDATNDLHYQFITKPVYIDKTKDLRETQTKLYEDLLFESIVVDTKTEIKKPCFWAMQIESNRT